MLRLPANIIGDVGMMLAGSVEEQISRDFANSIGFAAARFEKNKVKDLNASNATLHPI